MQSLIPRGVTVHPPEAAAIRERIKDEIIGIFKRWGFLPVITPLFEYYDEFFQTLDVSLKGALVKLVERETGRLIILRPDFTPQIARIAATIMKNEPRPLRLYYHGSVFRWSSNGTKTEKQIWQIGLELIGLDKPEAAAEMIAISKEILDTLRISNYRISISNISFLREVLSPFDEKTRKKVAFALARKDISELKEYLKDSDIEEKRKQLILSLPGFVGTESIIEDIKKIFVTPEIEKHLSNLQQVIEVLKNYELYENILIDLSEIRGMSYHNDIFFEVFAEGVGKRLAVGGRYDELMKTYGSDEPAVGFAVDLDTMCKATELSGTSIETDRINFLIVDLSRVKSKGVEIARKLRKKGYSVARDIIERGLSESLEYAKRFNIERVIVITDELKTLKKLELIDIKTSKSFIVDEERFIYFEKL